jgi:hypothetical protein
VGTTIDPSDPCAGVNALGAGPVQASLRDGQHGLARRVCPGNEVGVGGGGLVLIDTPDFYGQLRATAEIWGTYAASDDVEVFALFELYRFQTVISSLTATHSGIGHTALGATWRFWEMEALQLGITGRLVLPTAIDLYEHAWPFGADLGVNAEWRPLGWLGVHGQVTGVFSAAAGRGPALPRGGVLLLAGAALQPVDWFAVVADLGAGFGYTDAVDQVTASAELRFAISDSLNASLGAIFPFAGNERALTSAALRLVWHD